MADEGVTEATFVEICENTGVDERKEVSTHENMNGRNGMAFFFRPWKVDMIFGEFVITPDLIYKKGPLDVSLRAFSHSTFLWVKEASSHSMLLGTRGCLSILVLDLEPLRVAPAITEVKLEFVVLLAYTCRQFCRRFFLGCRRTFRYCTVRL